MINGKNSEVFSEFFFYYQKIIVKRLQTSYNMLKSGVDVQGEKEGLHDI